MEPRVSLALRRRRGRPMSAEALASEAGLAPSSVVEAVGELTHQGFEIESHPMLGFRLVAAPDCLREDEVACDLAVSRVGRRVCCLDTVSSTNDVAWESAERDADGADGLAVLAEHQSAGRGRRGNRWLSPPHASVLCSVVLWVPDAPGRGAILTRAAAVGVAAAIEDQCRLDVGIKWPNDLVIDGRKVGGILVEARPAAGGNGPVVIGAGINCTQRPEAFPPGLRPHVGSLAMWGEAVDRTLLARSLLERLDAAIARIDTAGGVADLRCQAMERCRTLGCRVTLAEEDRQYEGEVVDLDPEYGLVLRLAGGELRRFAPMTTHVVTPSEP
ncbi:MAG: biotin--[acetyl-CoA-carboxylase] ligase [Planctomycetes bacterium]|nr:biotin--[acetyl-CoA-carboxylase] ligase [Planctomycetota bacterium]